MNTVSDDHILSELVDIFRDVFDDDNVTLTMDSTAEDFDKWDSLNHINIVVACEMHFKIKFQTAEIESLKNVGELVELIRSKQAR
jgi:acyl carrier protein